MGEIIIKEVLTRKDRREFIYLPEKVHKNEPEWLPPIYMDERELYNKKKNKSYKYADALLLLAFPATINLLEELWALSITGIIQLIMNRTGVSVSWSASMTRMFSML